MVFCLPVHPWCSGYPYRINYLDRILEYIMGHEGVWQTTVSYKGIVLATTQFNLRR